ncbi:hypothetical protein [Microbacterium sp. LWH11-1.2]|uniref:hypothetical protein n=1 Tax=Microbacterium sp. LWH11-1.2 TaxID=3135258 RepID=UPI0031395C7E
MLLLQAEIALTADENINFENKIVLPIAPRIVAEQHMLAVLAALTLTEGIIGNQTQALFRAYKAGATGPTRRSAHSTATYS